MRLLLLLILSVYVLIKISQFFFPAKGLFGARKDPADPSSDKRKSKKMNNSPHGGEYIDFEEIK